jgi:hypothetical protein
MTGEFDYLLDPTHKAPEVVLSRKPPEAVVRKVTAPETGAPPPTPPERPGGRPVIRVEIEINQGGVARVKPGYSGRVVLAAVIWVIVLLILATLARAETWTSRRDGFMTRYQSDDGGTAQSYQQGFMTYYDQTLPDGSVRHCESYQQGFQTVLRCNP